MRLAALLLAAGSARRFGSDKLGADLGGQRLVDHAIAAVRASGASRLLMVTAPVGVGPIPAGFQHIVADQAAQGMGASLAAGISALNDACDAALVFLADMPFVPHAIAATLIEALGDNDATLPVWEGRRGHPALLSRHLFPKLRALRGEEGGRLILQGAKVAEVSAPDDGVLFDVDTPEALEAARLRLLRR